MTVRFILWCKRRRIDIETTKDKDVAFLLYVDKLEFKLKRKDRLIAEQSHQISILNELANKRSKDYEQSTSK